MRRLGKIRKRFLAALILLVALAAWLALEFAIRTAPLPPHLAAPAVPVLLDFRGEPFANPGTATIRDARPIPLRKMGRWLPLATVAIEDHRFRSHHGVDWHATAGAALRNVRNGRVVSGASTITQQTVKLLTDRTGRTLPVKAREALAALHLERTWSKDRILETYLNRLDYGNRRIGAVAGAFAYFGKTPADLSLAESIYLAGLPQSPTRLNPWRNPAAALARYRLNVTRLARTGNLPAGISAETLLASPPRVGRHYPPVEAPHFTALALARARVNEGPIPTTLDRQLQQTAEALLHEHLRLGSRLGIGDAAIVVIDNASGEVRALASHGLPEHRAIDATTTPRSSGSTLKPFIYLAALERRLITAATLLPDTPETLAYNDYDPQNYNQRSYGPVRARLALGNSLNVPAVHVVSLLGARRAFDALRQWGFQFPGSFDDYGAGFVLGNASVQLLDLAGAYAGLARGGLAWPARILPTAPLESHRLASPAATAILTDILCDNDARRLSFGTNSPLDLGTRVAVKTGTSSGFRDRWCVGFTKDHTVAVWAGNLDGRSLGETLAVRAAGPLWAAMTRHLLQNGDDPVTAPIPSEELVQSAIEPITGLVPDPSQDSVPEWFLANSTPATLAETMFTNIDGRPRLVLPPVYSAWCASPENHLAALVQSPDLQILFPRNGATYVRNPHLPATQQQIAPASNHPGTTWQLNQSPLATNSFPLTPGTHTLEATHQNRHASLTFTVE